MIEKKFGKTLKTSVLSKATLVGVMITLGANSQAWENEDVGAGDGNIGSNGEVGIIGTSGGAYTVSTTGVVDATGSHLTNASGISLGHQRDGGAGNDSFGLDASAGLLTIDINHDITSKSLAPAITSSSDANINLSGGLKIDVGTNINVSTGTSTVHGASAVYFLKGIAGSVGGSLQLINDGTLQGGTGGDNSFYMGGYGIRIGSSYDMFNPFVISDLDLDNSREILGANGSTDVNSDGGNKGGTGVHLQQTVNASTIDNSSANALIKGGSGGDGGAAGDTDGGQGANGIVLQNVAQTTITNGIGAKIHGGAGGNASAGAGGSADGGDGGDGVVISQSSKTDTITISNNGQIYGGDGGDAAAAVGTAVGGTGGYGINVQYTSDTTNVINITNNSFGVIQGGAGGAGASGGGAQSGEQGGEAIYIAEECTVNIVNTGNINGGSGGAGVSGGSAGAQGKALILSSFSTVNLENDGSMTGGIVMQTGPAVLNIQGSMSVGDISGGGGDMTVNVGYSDSSTAIIGAGVLDGRTGNITGTGAANVDISISGSGYVAGNIDFMNGDPSKACSLTFSGDKNNGAVASSVTGTVTGGNRVETITFNGSNAIGGDVDLGSGNDVVTVAAGKTATFNSGGVIGLDMGDNDDSITINGAATLSSNIVDLGDGANTFTFAADGGTLASALTGGTGVDFIDINGNSSITGDVSLGTGNNIVDIAADKKLTTGGDFTLGSNDTLKLVISDSTYSSVDVGGDLTIAAGAKFNVAGTVSGEINHPVVTYGGILTVDGVDKTAADFDFDAAYLDTAILDMTLHHVAADDTLYLTITASDIAPKGTTPGQEGIGKILDDITGGGSPSPEMDTMISTIQNLGTDAEVSQALQELSPVQMTAAPVAVLAATQSLGDVISGHVGNVSAGVTANRTASTNVKSGNGNVLMNVDTPPVRENEKWVPFFETFRSWGDQDDKDGISGYDFDTTGFVLGTDYLVDDRLLVGFSISKMDTTVDSNDNLATTDIDTWQGNVYGSYFTDTWHFDAHAGFGVAQIDSERSISFMGATAESDHDAPFYTVGVGAGYIFRPVEGMTLEPFCELDYMQMNEESYKEKGAGGANLEIDENDIESLRSKLGVRLAQRFEFEDGSAITPEFSYKWQHEFENDAIASSASFLNGGSSFKTTGMEPDADHHIFGAGIKAEVSDSVNIYANYEYDVSDTFSSNNALVGIEFKF